jgi:putative oxidoreductase
MQALFHRPELGLLIIRVAVGASLFWYGLQKFLGGQEALAAVGSNVSKLGIAVPTDTVLPLFFGIMAALVQSLGGALLVVGFAMRTAVAALLFVMLVALATAYDQSGGSFQSWGYPLIMVTTLLGLLFTGPGRLSIQKD